MNWFKNGTIIILAVLGFGLLACQERHVPKSSQVNETSKQVVEAINPQRKLLSRTLRVLDQSHQIFAESYKLLVTENSGVTPSSAMKVVRSRLGFGLSVKSKVISFNKSCPENHDEIQMTEVSEVNASVIRLVSVDCKLSSRQEVSVLTWLPNQNQMRFEVWPNQVQDGVGSSLSILNRKIICEASVNPVSDRVESLQCSSLGYGIDTSSHIEFKKFQYGLKHNDLLVIEANRYTNLFEKITCGSADACLKMTVPMEGRIHIVEDRKLPRLQNEVTLVPQKHEALTEVQKNGENEKENEKEKNNFEAQDKNQVVEPYFEEGQSQDESAEGGQQQQNIQASGRIQGAQPAVAGDQRSDLRPEELQR